MRQKPADELWVVILNEFTDAGIDALNVAQAAHGSFDVRLVAGGCLCCVGELEFGKQLRDILKKLQTGRLLIEPSGAGHAADIVDILSIYERQGALRLDSIVCLVDPIDAERILRARPANEWSQIQSADALLLSKPDLAGTRSAPHSMPLPPHNIRSSAISGPAVNGELPPQALQHFERDAVFSLLSERGAAAYESAPFDIGGLTGSEAHGRQLGLWAVQWRLPGELTFRAHAARTADALAARGLCGAVAPHEGRVPHRTRPLLAGAEHRARFVRRGQRLSPRQPRGTGAHRGADAGIPGTVAPSAARCGESARLSDGRVKCR
jgi:hypothetical protein